MSEGKNTVVVRRRIAATRDELFAAWIEPEGMREWMCPGDVISADVRLDPRVGGTLLILMKSPTQTHEHSGEFRVVDRPTKLAFTWTANNLDGQVTLVTVEFFAISGEETDLVLTHELIPRQEVSDRYQSGWTKIVEHLEKYVLRRKGTHA